MKNLEIFEPLFEKVAKTFGTPQGQDTHAKRARIGVEVLFCQEAGLVDLLIEKKIITREEYERAVEVAVKRETR